MCHHLLLLRVSGRFSAQVAPFVTPTAWFVLASAISFYPTTQLRAADPPATPEKAAEVIDFTKFELVRPLESDAVLNRRIAGQSYIATGTVNEIAGRHPPKKARPVGPSWLVVTSLRRQTCPSPTTSGRLRRRSLLGGAARHDICLLHANLRLR
jgi:hypothetical protein